MSYTSDSIDRMKAHALAQFRQNKKFLKKLGQLKPNKLDQQILAEHEREFIRIDCMECANCCKTISPSISDTDVRRMAANVKMKIPDFINKYLLADKDEDFIFKQTPCPFLGHDNYCSIYESRPKACREYPHTNRKRFHQIIDLTARNTKVCPAVFNITDRLKKAK